MDYCLHRGRYGSWSWRFQSGTIVVLSRHNWWCAISIFKNSVLTSDVLSDFAVRCRKLSLGEITLSRFQVSVLWTFSCIFTWDCLTLSVVSNSVAVPSLETLTNISRHSHYSPRTFRFTQDHIGVTSWILTTWFVDASDTKIIGLVFDRSGDHWLCHCRFFRKFLSLFSLRHGSRNFGEIWNKMTEMTTRKRVPSHDVLPSKKVVSLIFGETIFR